jgi:hypothetical protein
MFQTDDSNEAKELNEAELRRLVELAKIDVSGPPSFPLESVTMLDLCGCGLEELPQGFEKAFPNLSILFLSNNRFREMPAVIGYCPKLQMVAFKSNQLESIHPEALQPQLRWLILTNNRISCIPDTIGRCKLLQKCMLSGNRIQQLPQTIENCTNLELIRLASNQLSEPPLALLQLPRLAWIALSDNPFLKNLVASHHETLPVLKDVDETSGEILGQGAGGVTRKIMYNGKHVAVKTFVGAMTSDGLPAEERRVTCAASTLQCSAHVDVVGQTEAGSLVMEYVSVAPWDGLHFFTGSYSRLPTLALALSSLFICHLQLDSFHPISDPPTYESCSRDVYPADRQLTVQQGQSIIADLLGALTMLHKEGICHGDFYGHNILIHAYDLSQVRLTDFGAAFFYDKSDKGSLFERIELRAFAIFVEEVNALLVGRKLDLLTSLVELCRSEDPGTNFESAFIWLKQKQLANMAEAFGAGIEDDANEEKES